MPVAANEKETWLEISFPQKELNFILDLYQKYRDDLALVKQQQQQLYAIRYSIGLSPQLGDLEAEITYLRLRALKPATVVEISPASGWSTSWILHALRDNGFGMLHSYDLVDDSTRVIPQRLASGRWKFYQGDIQQYTHLLPPAADYLFIDSDHSAAFAHWYIDTLFPKFGPGTAVSVHDILKASYEPGWGEESLVLCAWLAKRKVPCMTASRALKHQGHTAIMLLRFKLGLQTIIPENYNSMIYFNL